MSWKDALRHLQKEGQKSRFEKVPDSVKTRTGTAKTDTVQADPAADRRLFKTAMQNVRPLPPHGRAQLKKPPPLPLPRQKEQDEINAVRESLSGVLSAEDRLDWETGYAEETPDGLPSVFLRPGLRRRVLTDIRRGKWVIEAEIDLHGLTRENAGEALQNFLESANRRGQRLLRVIHGKGLSSPGRQPVLKNFTRNWLIRHQEVLAFCPATPRDGGEGALLILLKTRTRHEGKNA